MSLSRAFKLSHQFTHTRTKKFFSSQIIAKPLTAEILARRFKLASIIPVLSIPKTEVAIPLVQALIDGGLNVIEIALRTPCSLHAIELIRKNFSEEQVTLGAATVITESQFRDAKNAGAQFAASPLYRETLLNYANGCHFPYIPCVENTEQIGRAADAGFNKLLKAFPLDRTPDDGQKFLSDSTTFKILQELGGIKLCTSRYQTNPQNIETDLKHSTVAAIASGWSAPDDLVLRGHWNGIRFLASDSKKRANAVLMNTNLHSSPIKRRI